MKDQFPLMQFPLGVVRKYKKVDTIFSLDQCWFDSRNWNPLRVVTLTHLIS